MSADEIFDGIQAVVREHLRLDVPITRHTDIQGDLRLDSIQRLTLVVELENRFLVCFDAEDELGLETFADVVRLIQRRRAEAA